MPPKLGRPTAVIKDWDGTITDSLTLVHQIHTELLIEFGHRAPTFAETLSMTAYGARSGVVQWGMTEEQGAEFARRFGEAYFVFRPDISLMPGAAEWLATIDTSVPMAVLSNKKGDMLREEIAHFGLTDRFKAIVGLHEAPIGKPSPKAALHTLELMGIEPGPDVWFIGDTHGDIECALGAGLTAILISTHEYNGPQPSFHFPDLHALVKAYNDSDTYHITANSAAAS